MYARIQSETGASKTGHRSEGTAVTLLGETLSVRAMGRAWPGGIRCRGETCRIDASLGLVQMGRFVDMKKEEEAVRLSPNSVSD